MTLELRDKEIISWLKEYGIPLNKTRIYLSNPPSDPWKKRGLIEAGAVFFPRFCEGYVFSFQDLHEILIKYVHELTHGAFFENFPVGKLIAELDEKIGGKERELLCYADANDTIIITTPNLPEKSRSINLKEAEKLLRERGLEQKISTIQLQEKQIQIFEVDKSEFEDYVSSSNRLNSLYSLFLPYLEGFALLMEEEIVRRQIIASDLPIGKFVLNQPPIQEILIRRLTPDRQSLSGSYKTGYELLKPIKNRNGLTGLVQWLYELKERV